VHRHSDAATALWSITAIPPTEASWKWQCLGRAFLSVVLPVITAVPLIPYALRARQVCPDRDCTAAGDYGVADFKLYVGAGGSV